MSTVYADEDIYSDDGVLLLAKGQKITEDVMKKLQKFNIRKAETASSKNDIILSNCTNGIMNKFKNLDDMLIKDSNRILSEVIFSSKTSPWWMLVNALSNYVDWLYTHSIDVALISLIVAIRLGYDKVRQKQLCLGALLHDIGKLLIPKSIIQKEYRLNHQEMALMRQHCELGYDMTKELNLSQTCMNVILQHHERLDGSGYPHGLRDHQIADETKIVMIADVLDAITSYRPYRPNRDIKEALALLRSEKTKFKEDYVGILENFLNT